MLCFSKPGLIKLIPALLRKWVRGSVKGSLCCSGVTVDILWDMEAKRIQIAPRFRTAQQVHSR